jgi:hypothetical protein
MHGPTNPKFLMNVYLPHLNIQINLDPHKFRREFVKELRKENTVEDLWTGSRGGIFGELEIMKN